MYTLAKINLRVRASSSDIRLRRADTPIAYTYDVFWEESDITWERRWDGYLRLPHLWVREHVCPSLNHAKHQQPLAAAFLCAYGHAASHQDKEKDLPLCSAFAILTRGVSGSGAGSVGERAHIRHGGRRPGHRRR